MRRILFPVMVLLGAAEAQELPAREALAPIADVRSLWAGPDQLPEGSLFGQFQAYQENRKFVTEPVLPGEPVSELLVRSGIEPGDAAEAAETLLAAAGEAQLAPGTPVRIKFNDDQLTEAQRVSGGGWRGLEALEVLLPSGLLVVLGREDAAFKADRRLIDVETRYVAAAAEISSSLFGAAQNAGVPRELMLQFADIFAFDVDFAREIYRGDRFEIVWEVKVDQEGNEIATGEVVFAALTWRGGQFSQGYYRYTPLGDDESSYFGANGRDPRTQLMKSPINGARVTSRFGRRRHPVLGFTKGHNGVDFGAPTGTPIMAAGDGTIKLAGPRGTFGNYIQIEHSGGLETAYAHLQRFAAGIAPGAEVKQGDVIGYVGTTGRSTGPHLHYEVLQDGQPQNPETIKVAVGQTLRDDDLKSFVVRRENADDLRIKPFAVSQKALPQN